MNATRMPMWRERLQVTKNVPHFNSNVLSTHTTTLTTNIRCDVATRADTTPNAAMLPWRASISIENLWTYQNNDHACCTCMLTFETREHIINNDVHVSKRTTNHHVRMWHHFYQISCIYINRFNLTCMLYDMGNAIPYPLYLSPYPRCHVAYSIS